MIGGREPRPAEILRRAALGAVLLGGGQVAAQALNIAGLIALARMLSPADFGLVAIFIFFLSLLTALGDLGLGMSLVRQEDEPTVREYAAVSSFVHVVACVVLLGALASAPLELWAYDIPARDWWLFPVMGLAILADSVRFLPLVHLERSLRYEGVGAIEFGQAVVFNVVLLTLAYSGMRAACFPVAVVARSVSGACIAHVVGPRLHRSWLWHWPTVRRLLLIGLPFQGVHLLTVARASIVPIFVGLLIGKAAVGHLEWAALTAGFPLTGLILFQRLYVGSFSRLRNHPADLSGFVTRVLLIAHAFVAPIAAVTMVLIEPIVRLVFGEAWLVAIPLFRWLWLGCLVVPTIAPLTGLLHALGHSRIVFRSMLTASIATWLVGVPLVLWLGETGTAIAHVAVHSAGFVIWREARRQVPFRVLIPAALTWAATLPSAALAWWWLAAMPFTSVPQLVLCGLAAVLLDLLVFGVGVVVLGPKARNMLTLRTSPQSAPLLRALGDESP